jgi:hypothetical protein
MAKREYNNTDAPAQVWQTINLMRKTDHYWAAETDVVNPQTGKKIWVAIGKWENGKFVGVTEAVADALLKRLANGESVESIMKEHPLGANAVQSKSAKADKKTLRIPDGMTYDEAVAKLAAAPAPAPAQIATNVVELPDGVERENVNKLLGLMAQGYKACVFPKDMEAEQRKAVATALHNGKVVELLTKSAENRLIGFDTATDTALALDVLGLLPEEGATAEQVIVLGNPADRQNALDALEAAQVGVVNEAA